MIVYALVARGKTVLAEFTMTSGNFPTVTRLLLSKIPLEDAKMSYVYDRHVFHYVVEDGMTYLCMADNKSRRRVAFAFLEDAKIRFTRQYSQVLATAPAFMMNPDFAPILERQMAYYNTEKDDISRVKNQLDDVKNVMVENIEKVLERGEKIELLVDKTDRLSHQAFKFEKTSKQLREALFWKKVKMYFIVAATLCSIVLFVSMIYCGGPHFPSCRSAKRTPR